MSHGPVHDDVPGAYAEAEAQRQRLRLFVEFAAEGHVLTDGHGVVLDANPSAAGILRCPKEFLLGKPLGLFLAPGCRPRFYQGLVRLHRGARSDEFETRFGRQEEARNVWLQVTESGIGEGTEESFRWVLRDITGQRRAEAARDDLLRRLVHVQEAERGRVARELHDSFGQLLTALLLTLRAVRDAGPMPAPARERLQEVQRIAEELGRVGHELAVRLRPTVLDDLGLASALQQHVADWSARTGVTAQFQAFGVGDLRFPTEAETALYRIVQEALTNVARHAGAGVVSVLLSRQERCVVAVIEDNGAGFDTEAALDSGRLGLLGMRERASLAGGVLVVESSPGSGTTVVARLPLQPPEEASPHGH